MTTRKPQPDDVPEIFLSTQQVAALLGICTKTLRTWEQLGIFPKGIRINARVVRWHHDVVTAWIEEKKNRHQGGANRQ